MPRAAPCAGTGPLGAIQSRGSAGERQGPRWMVCPGWAWGGPQGPRPAPPSLRRRCPPPARLSQAEERMRSPGHPLLARGMKPPPLPLRGWSASGAEGPASPSEQKQEQKPEQKQAHEALEGPAPRREPPPVLQAVRDEMERMGLSDTDLQSKPMHYFWVASACAALLTLLARGTLGGADPASALASLGWSVLAYLAADAATGLYHFGVDNYGSAATPVFGAQIDAFQGHHRRPWTITKREFANNLHALARPVLFTALGLLLLPASHERDTLGSVFFACVMFSQQFHAWAHTPRPLLHPAVVALQDAGLLVSRKMHGAHHRPPFSSNYCIVSGICNGPLDSLGVFRALEKFIFLRTGVPSRSWSSDAPEWLEGGELAYYEDGSDCVE